MAIFFGVCSGVAFGKVTVRTPSTTDALISSGYAQSKRLTQPVLALNTHTKKRAYITQENRTYLGVFWQRNAPRELAKSTLTHAIHRLLRVFSIGVVVVRRLGLARDDQTVVVQVDRHVLLLQPWQLERGHQRVVWAVMQVQSIDREGRM